MIGETEAATMTPGQERNYNHYNQSETTPCQQRGKDFIFVRRARIGTVAYRQAGRKRKYCYDCSPPSNSKTRNDLTKWSGKTMLGVPLKEPIENPKVQIRICKSTVRRLKSKRIPPESYDDLINRVFDEHRNMVIK